MKNKIFKLLQNRWTILLLCLLFSCLLFSNNFQNDFVFDDVAVIRDNQILKNIQNLPQLFTSYYRLSSAGLYRPMTMASYALNYFLFGSSVWSFHLINIILHALNCWLLFLLIRRLCAKKFLAYLTAFLFLILPIHTEAVTGLVGRAELLAFFFSFLALLFLIQPPSESSGKNKLHPIFRIYEKEGIILSGQLFNNWPLVSGTFCFLFALLSKETALAVLPIYFLIILYHKQFNKNTFKNLLGLGLTLVIYFGIRRLVLGPYFAANNATLVENPLKFVSISARILTALKILALYFWKIIFPLHLSSDYSYNQITIVQNLASWPTIIGLAGIIFYVYILARRQKIALPFYLGSTIFFWSFLPISNLFFPIGTIMAERLMYFPSAGICLILSALILNLTKIKPLKLFKWMTIVVLLSLNIFYLGRTWLRNYDWRDQKILFFSAAQSSPNSVLARSNKGAIYLLENNYRIAEKEILAANQIYPDYPPAVNNLGLIYRHQGDLKKAEEQFLRAIEIANYPPAFENLGLVYLDLGQYAEAKKWLLPFFGHNQKIVNSYLQQYFEMKINEAMAGGDQKSAAQWLEKAKEILTD